MPLALISKPLNPEEELVKGLSVLACLAWKAHSKNQTGSLHERLSHYDVGNANMKQYNEDGTSFERKGDKKKNTKTLDNFGYGDMPADFRKRYKKMLEQGKKK